MPLISENLIRIGSHNWDFQVYRIITILFVYPVELQITMAAPEGIYFKMLEHFGLRMGKGFFSLSLSLSLTHTHTHTHTHTPFYLPLVMSSCRLMLMMFSTHENNKRDTTSLQFQYRKAPKRANIERLDSLTKWTQLYKNKYLSTKLYCEFL